MTNINDLLDLNYSEHSHKIIDVECELKLSKNCRNKYKIVYRDGYITCKKHNNLIVCMNCSRIVKASNKSKGVGRMNPNTKYLTLNDNFFEKIDTKDKAYILGWIASDGSIQKNSVVINIHEKDRECLEKIRDHFCGELPIKVYAEYSDSGDKTLFVSLTINSKTIVNDVCKHLQITPGKKAEHVKFPDAIPNELKIHFIRGYFDGDGSINSPLKSKKRFPVASISSLSVSMKKSIKEEINIPCYFNENNQKANLEYCGNNALDFLSKIYDTNELLFLKRKKELYYSWASWTPSLTGSSTFGTTEEEYENNKFTFKWNKSLKEAIKPSKTNASDSGYDLTLIKLDKQIGEVFMYDTGIKVTPDYGWYFDLVPRSSIIKSGYILANSVGVIDRTYVGSIKVPLIKIDKSMPDLSLPNRLVQIIPRQIIHMEPVEVCDLEETSRMDGGFGSTGNQ